jgi:Kef-type K+ transport system membrane component KefB
MEPIFITASLWLALAVVSALIASSIGLSIALVEICVGVGAAAATGSFGLGDVFASNSEWVRFLAASGAVVLTFRAGAELDPDIVRKMLTEVSVVALASLPSTTAWLTRHYAYRTAAIRTKWVMLILFGLGALALWSGSEAVLPAYLVGMVLAGSAARDAHWIRRLRTLTVGFLTPFYFLRAGTLVSLPALLAAPLVFVALLMGKVASKIFGLYPLISVFRQDHNERWYYTLMMSTGLTFGTISSLYGLAHELVTQEQYSFLVAAVIASAVVPTLIAGLAFVPAHLLPRPDQLGKAVRRINGLSDEG